MRSIRLLAENDYDFSNVAGGLSLTIPLMQKLRVTTLGCGNIVFRLHKASIPSGANVRLVLREAAPTEEDPPTFFRGRIVGVAQLDSASTAPAIAAAYVGLTTAYVAVFLVVTQAATATTFTCTLSADLVPRDTVNPWTPASLAGKLTLWLDDRDQTIVSSAVSNWGDESGTGNSFSQSTAANRPSGGSLLNGWPAPNFVAANANSMGGPAISAFINASAYHVFAVFRARTASGTNATVYLNNGVVADTGIGWWGMYLKNTAGVPELHGFHWDSTSRDVVISPFPLSTDVLVEWSYDGSTLALRLGAGPTATLAGGGAIGSVANAGQLGIGATGSLNLDGLVASIVVCKQKLSNADAGAARAYLSSKYGVPA